MAVKNRSLDPKIIAAARAEFLEKGFQKASLHKIAEKAGITTGALYTRYQNKDALFQSLMEDFFTAAKNMSGSLYQEYADAQKSGDLTRILAVIHKEEKIYQELMFDHYEACVLFYCKSAGSRAEAMLNEMMRQKTHQTVEYFKAIAKTSLDLDGVGMILDQQFHFYRQILEKGYSREKALACMELVSIYQEAGWRALFQVIL